MSRPKIRKTNAAARKKAREEAQRVLAERTSLMMGHPKECSMCRKPFERTHETVKEWMVVVREETKTTRLACPECWRKVNQLVEEEIHHED